MTAVIDPGIDMVTPPLDQVNSMSAEDFFDYALGLMRLHPRHLRDWSLVAQMRRLGLVAGARVADLYPAVRSALHDVPTAAMQALQQALPGLAKIVNGWQMNTDTIGVYGNFYAKRAAITMIGLGANSAEDAVYPILMADADGKPPTGDRAGGQFPS